MWSGGCLNNIFASHASCAAWLPDSLSCLQLEYMWATFPHSSSRVSIFFLFLIFNLQRCEFPLDELLIGHTLFFPWILSVSFKGMIYWGQKAVSDHLHVASFPLLLSCPPLSGSALRAPRYLKSLLLPWVVLLLGSQLPGSHRANLLGHCILLETPYLSQGCRK